MTRVEFTFETDSVFLAQAVKKDLDYGIENTSSGIGSYGFQGFIAFKALDQHIGNLERMYRTHPNASAKFTYSYGGVEGTCINRNGELIETETDTGYVPYEQLDGYVMNVTLTTDNREVKETVRDLLKTKYEDWEENGYFIYRDWEENVDSFHFPWEQCRQLIEKLQEVEQHHNTTIYMVDAEGLPGWCKCQFVDGKMLE